MSPWFICAVYQALLGPFVDFVSKHNFFCTVMYKMSLGRKAPMWLMAADRKTPKQLLNSEKQGKQKNRQGF